MAKKKKRSSPRPRTRKAARKAVRLEVFQAPEPWVPANDDDLAEFAGHPIYNIEVVRTTPYTYYRIPNSSNLLTPSGSPKIRTITSIN